MTAATARTGTEWLRNQARKVSDGEDLPVSAGEAGAVGVESWLQDRGVQYAPPGPVPMNLIDEARSRSNQARKDPIVAESVDRFAVAMRDGAVFPPIVTYPLDGKLTIIDGNNRQAAARKAGFDTITGIVIAADTPSELIQLLTVEANSHHGVTPDLSWRLQQAFHLCSLGFEDPVAAQSAGVSVTQFRNARAVREADQRARHLRLGRFTDLPPGVRQALGVLKDEAVFFQAARLAVDTAMTIEEVRDMTREVKKLPSEGARIEYIGALAKRRSIERATRRALGKAVHRVSSPKHSLVAGIGKVLNVDEAALVRAIITTTDRDAVRERLSELQEKLDSLKVAMGTLDKLGK